MTQAITHLATQHAVNQNNVDRILRPAEVQQHLSISPATYYRRIADGSLPPQIQISPRCVGIKASALQAWLDAK